MSSHYRQPLDWSDIHVDQARQTLDRFYLALRGLEITSLEETLPDSRIIEALSDDLNIPLVLSLLHEMVNQMNKTSCLDEKIEKAKIFKRSASFLGILQQSPESWFQQITPHPLDSCFIEKLIEDRRKARLSHRFKEADRIRQELLDQGIILEDSETGTTWRCS
jgi:cysteinyl-tRNA synthetase